jgi:hypothetical protein
MNTLIFEGAGWEKAESSIKSGVGNCRIRTRIRNNDGRMIYLEMGCMDYSKKHKSKIPLQFRDYGIVGFVDHVFYADSKWDSNRSYSQGLRESNRKNFEFSKEEIVKFVNENLNCSFDNMEVVNDNSVRVHDTAEPLCDCSKADYTPYKDIEVNINVLDIVKPLQLFTDHRLAHYKLSYDFIKQVSGLKKWMEERDQQEQEKFSNYNYYVILRWNENGIITDAEISSYQNFVLMGMGIEDLFSILDGVMLCYINQN